MEILNLIVSFALGFWLALVGIRLVLESGDDITIIDGKVKFVKRDV